MRVLVTDGANRAALAVTRSLGRAGHEVLVGEKEAPALAQTSHFCHERVCYPDPAQASDDFVNVIADVVRTRRVDLLLPVADVTTFLLTRHRERMGRCALPFADADVIERVADKVDVVRTAAALGVPVPKHVVITHPRSRVGLPCDFPLVVKPWRSRVRTAAGWASTSVSFVHDDQELARDLSSRKVHEFPVMLQERIEGPALGVFACYSRGRPVALFSHRRLRERPPWGGVSVLSESVPPGSVAERFALNLLDAIGWHGVAMVEFKVDRRTGEPKLMEINGRLWGSLQLAIDAGVDFPRALLETVLPEPQARAWPYTNGVRSRWLWGDFDSLLQTLFWHGGPADSSAAARHRLRAVADFARFWSPSLHYDNPKWDDPKPFVFESIQRARAVASKLMRRRQPVGRSEGSAAEGGVARSRPVSTP